MIDSLDIFRISASFLTATMSASSFSPMVGMVLASATHAGRSGEAVGKTTSALVVGYCVSEAAKGDPPTSIEMSRVTSGGARNPCHEPVVTGVVMV